ncbi:MAG: ribosome recycling factor [Desulfobacteraceae bacterium]|nr:ribosome recycling factor [Desulfobacteraceae bacterium]
MHKLVSDMRDKMAKSIDAYRRELTKIRTGRASLAIFDGIKIESYGTQMPLNQVATITIPESRMIVIQPWDVQLINTIDKAILKANLGLNPVSDGKVIRLAVPQLTEERRKELVKQVKKVGEEFKVAVRNCRRDALEVAKKMKKDKEISEDDLFAMQESAQKETDLFIKQIDDSMVEKEKEVMEV